MYSKAEIIDRGIEAVKNDFDSGGTQIVHNAITVVKAVLANCPFKNQTNKINAYLGKIASAKPSMPALRNIVIYIQSILNTIEEPYDENFPFDSIISKIEISSEEVVKQAVNEIFIKNGFRKILSCSLSSTVFKIFLKASEVNIKFSVTALESVWNNKSYGLELMKKCHESNINCVAVKDTEIPSAVQESDCALVGADAIIAVGGAVNGFPSLGLSHSCKNVIPFYIAAESFKFTKKYIVEDGFEYIPSDLITKIITDEPALWGEISDL